MTSNNFYLVVKDSSIFHEFSVPVLWASMKTYYEENSLKSNEWSWSNPYFGLNSIEEMFDEFRQAPPNVIGFSVYVWNEEFVDNVAKQIKHKYPDCLVVYGGPQQNVKHNENYFKERPWVDIAVPGDAYGEIIIKEILDNYPIADFSAIPYIYYTNSSRERFMSPLALEKRSFVWPSNIFKAQEKYILSKLQEKRATQKLVAYYDTSRGCPYKCIYCDWGGGTYTKVVKKPYTTVLDELEWLARVAKVSNIDIIDANFGIMSIDVEIAKHLAELKSNYGYPLNVAVSNAKNNHERVLDIAKILLDAGLLDSYVIAIQTLNETTKKNIERTDIPFDKRIEGYNYLRSRPNGNKLNVYIEYIIGLPGDNYQSICDQIDLIYKHNLPLSNVYNHSWILLPETPAYTAEMREQFKIKTINKVIDSKTKYKSTATVTNQNLISIGSWTNQSVETVVSTYSYTVEEWIMMARLSHFVIAAEQLGITTTLIRYLVDKYSVTPTTIFTAILNYIYQTKFSNTTLRNLFELEDTQFNTWMSNDTTQSGIDLGNEVPFLLSHSDFYRLVVLVNGNEFYNEIGKYLCEQFSNDTHIIDLCNNLKNSSLNTKNGSIINYAELYYKMVSTSNENLLRLT